MQTVLNQNTTRCLRSGTTEPDLGSRKPKLRGQLREAFRPAIPSPLTWLRAIATSERAKSFSATRMSKTAMIYTHVLDRGPTGDERRNYLATKVLARLWRPHKRRLIPAEDRNSASYAHSSKHC